MSTSTPAAVTVSKDELQRRTIRRGDLVSCNQAFIDCRTPGSDKKENYALIGSGVSQSSDQVINLQEPHGYNVGAAAMPNGVTNSLHIHFTAEVFLNFRGDWLFRWGPGGSHGEYHSRPGDVLTVPTWIFRGFTNIGQDDGWLFTVLGRDNTGGIIWGPSVLREAEGFGLYLTADNQLIDTVAGDEIPEAAELVRPMPDEVVDSLRHYTPEQMRSRITSESDRVWSDTPFLCSVLPGGRAQLASVIGWGMTEDRNQEPRVVNPHGFSLAWLRADPGEGLLRFRQDKSQVLVVRDGTWQVTLNEGADEISVQLHSEDTLSVPEGAWRSLSNVGDERAELVVINGGDDRTVLQWAPEVVEAAREKDLGRDANGYVAPWSLVSRTVADD